LNRQPAFSAYGFAPFCSTHGVPRLRRCYQLFDIAGAIEEGVVGMQMGKFSRGIALVRGGSGGDAADVQKWCGLRKRGSGIVVWGSFACQ
jgi:hypothetical protein